MQIIMLCKWLCYANANDYVMQMISKWLCYANDYDLQIIILYD